jgi:hypothetical protein
MFGDRSRPRMPLPKQENDRLRQELALLQEEMRIPAQRRPHYPG